MSDNHVESRALRELHNLDFLDHAVMGDELQGQIRRRLTSAAMAYRVPLDDLELRVEAFEHAQALPDQGVGFDGLALVIEQERVAFDFGEHEFAAVSREDRLQQLVDDVGAVYELGLGQELRVAANIRKQDRCAFSHGTPSSKVVGLVLDRFARVIRGKHRGSA